MYVGPLRFVKLGSIVFDLDIPISRVLHDTMHGQLLGTGKAVNGSAIVYLAEAGFWGPLDKGIYEHVLAERLREAHKQFLTWMREHRIRVSQPRFTPARLNRKLRSSYPSLSSKAIPSKTVSFWIAECAVAYAGRADASTVDRLVATCLHSYTTALRIMDTADMVMSETEANSYCNNCLTHLQTYAALHTFSRDAQKKENNRTLWLLTPKHHYFYEHAKVTRRERVNPRMSQLLCAEDWVGRVGRIARATHRQNVSLRTLERYIALLHIELSRS